VLETLGPTERAVFVLREVFDVPYDEIAEAVGKTPAAVRQIAHRAKDHVAARRPRIQVERDEQERVIGRFLAALNTGDLQGLMDVMAPDVVLVADGGGVVTAAVRPIVGAEKLGAFFAAGLAAVGPGLVGSPMLLNGAPGARVEVDGELVGAISLTVENGLITRIHSIVNPQKLARLDEESTLVR
jgi:hypothetical protein